MGDDVEESWEPLVDVLAAERDTSHVAAIDLSDETGLAEDPEVVGARRLRDRQSEAGAGAFHTDITVQQVVDHLPPQRIAERGEDVTQLDLGGVRMAFCVWHLHPPQVLFA
jgi:hypothetical protein